MKELELLLDIEFKDNDELMARFFDCNLSLKDNAVIYFALKHYLGHLATNGAGMSRIRHCIDLAYEFKDLAKDYCDFVIKQYNPIGEYDIKELDEDTLNIEEIKSKLVN
jgi:hypothetical protein